MEKNKKNVINEDIEKLLELLKLCNNKKGYDNKKQGVKLLFSSLEVSSSGMSRKFYIHAITKKGELLNLTYLIHKILGYTFTSDYKIRVGGCGMDMLFNTCYCLNCKIYDYKTGSKGKYNYDKAYHGYVNTFYDLI